MDDKYFATLPSDELADELLKRKDEYYRYLETTGHRELLLRAYDTYYKPGQLKGGLYSTGEQGQFVNICVNQYRNLVQHRLIMTTSQRPAFEPKAVNTDAESQAQCILAKGLLEYYSKVKKMERSLYKATEFAINFGEGFVGTFWNPTKGSLYAPATPDAPAKFDGDLEFESFHTFDIIRSVGRRSEEQHSWTMVRRRRNKWDYVAKFPELADKIKAKKDDVNDTVGNRSRFLERFNIENEVEDLTVYTFYHRVSEAMPQGRIFEFSDSDIIFSDGPIPYDGIPIFRISGGEQEERIYGYSNAFDILPLQEAVDKLHSTVITNQAAFGVQNIAIPKGNGISVSAVAGGLNLVEFDSKLGPPVPLVLCATPPEIFKYIEQLEHEMETLFGVNSVARGNPEASLKSGAALALVQSMAIQFAQGLQLSYAQLLEDTGTSVISILQRFAETERVAEIVGKDNSPYLQKFKGSGLAKIQRVTCDMGNPLTDTLGGRINMADQLISRNLVTTPQQYIEVLTTGRIEPMYAGEQAELSLIRDENEAIYRGEMPPVLATDDHKLHLSEHRITVNSVVNRSNPRIVQAALAHMMEHNKHLAPPVPGPQGLQRDNMAMPHTPSGTPAASGGQFSTQNPTEAAAMSVRPAQQPKNPLTGAPNAK